MKTPERLRLTQDYDGMPEGSVFHNVRSHPFDSALWLVDWACMGVTVSGIDVPKALCKEHIVVRTKPFRVLRDAMPKSNMVADALGDQRGERPARAANKVPCPAAEHMGEHQCDNHLQCFEPCGALGHDERHVRVSRDPATIRKLELESRAAPLRFNMNGVTDSRKWAKAFVEAMESVDEQTMVTWFANAIEAGRMAEAKLNEERLAKATAHTARVFAAVDDAIATLHIARSLK